MITSIKVLNTKANLSMTMAAALFITAALPSKSVHAAAGTTNRVSLTSAAAQGNGTSSEPAVSAGGRYVVFHSAASNLVAGDTNGVADVFVRDRRTGTTTRVSVGSGGVQSNGGSTTAAMSSDGRYIAFASAATNLVAGDTNGVNDIFVHDRQTGTTTRVSVNSSGDAGNGGSRFPALSGGGRYVAFESGATNLVAGDTNGMRDIFLHDRQTGSTRRVSVSSSGQAANGHSEYPSLSADGRFIAFASAASNLVAGDTNGALDVFLRDTQTNTTTRVSVSSAGTQGNGISYDAALSGNGRFIAFGSAASNLVANDTNGNEDIFIHDRRTGATTRVSVGRRGRAANGPSFYPAVSATGRFVVFSSVASNLVSGDTNGTVDTFVRDRGIAFTQRVSLNSDAVQANRAAVNPAVSGNGRFVAFESEATNLVAGDTNGTQDVFLHERFPMLSVAKAGTGTGVVTTLPVGIYCDGTRVCRKFFASGTSIALTATPDAGTTFRGWGGHADCADGVVTLRIDQRCVARFVPTVTVAATDSTATEARQTTGRFTFTRTGSTARAMTVFFQISGTATAGRDYRRLGSSVRFPAGARTVTKTVRPVNDVLREQRENVTLALAMRAGYIVGAERRATVQIISND